MYHLPRFPHMAWVDPRNSFQTLFPRAPRAGLNPQPSIFKSGDLTTRPCSPNTRPCSPRLPQIHRIGSTTWSQASTYKWGHFGVLWMVTHVTMPHGSLSTYSNFIYHTQVTIYMLLYDWHATCEPSNIYN